MFPLHVLRSNPKLGSSHVAKETLLSKRKVIKFYSEDYSSLFEMMKNWHYIYSFETKNLFRIQKRSDLFCVSNTKILLFHKSS